MYCKFEKRTQNIKMILEYRKIHNSYITEYSEINTRNDK